MTGKFFAIVIGVLCLLLMMTGVVMAMSSTNYQLDWFVPLTGSGGAMDSTHYAANITLGQSAIGTADSANDSVCLGYWCGADVTYTVYLPLILRN